MPLLADHDAVERLSDRLFSRYSKKMEGAFVAGVQATIDSDAYKQITESIRMTGNAPDWMIAALEFDMRAMSIVFRDAAHASAIATNALAMGSVSKTVVPPTIYDPNFIAEMLRQAKKAGADLDAKTRNALRTLLSRAIRNNLSWNELADLLANSIGLDTRYAAAVENYRRGLVDKGVTNAKARKMAKEYAARLRATRARTIARTEVMRALNAGQQTGYAQSLQSLGIPSSDAELEWIVTRDDRLCEYCAPMAGERTSVTSPLFQTGMGDTSGPPLHPNCRCTTTMRFDRPFGVSKADKPLKDPKGGLTAAGRKKYAEETGSHLKPGVKNYGKASTADKKRWISWALRFYGQKNYPPLVKPNGDPTRFALTAAAWGEPVPKTEAAARAIAAKARKRQKELESVEKGGEMILHCIAKQGDLYAAFDPHNMEAVYLVGRGRAVRVRDWVALSKSGKWQDQRGPIVVGESVIAKAE